MKWTMYYADGSKFSDADGSPQTSPKDFLVAIFQEGALLTGEYFTFRGRWYQHDQYGLIDQMKHHAEDIDAMRPGYYVDDRLYNELVERARTESK